MCNSFSTPGVAKCFQINTCVCCRRLMAASLCLLALCNPIQFPGQKQAADNLLLNSLMLMCFKLWFWPAAHRLLRLTIMALAQTPILALFRDLSDKPASVLIWRVVSSPPTTVYSTVQLDLSLARAANYSLHA